MRVYRGKVPCVGCKQTGEQQARDSKESLCDDCKKLLRLGKTYQQESATEYTFISQHQWAKYDRGSDKENSINTHLAHLLKSINYPQAVPHHSLHNPFGGGHSSGHYHVTIPTKIVQPLIDFIDHMNGLKQQLDDGLKDLKEHQESAIAEVQQQERTKIFNEGIEQGKNLLLMLEAGTITMNDFAEQLPYHKPQ